MLHVIQELFLIQHINIKWLLRSSAAATGDTDFNIGLITANIDVILTSILNSQYHGTVHEVHYFKCLDKKPSIQLKLKYKENKSHFLLLL